MGRPPQTICARLDMPVNALQFCRWKFTHKETLQQTFFERSTLLQEKWSICVFEPLWGVWATNAVHLRLIRKPIVNFLLVIIELFSLGQGLSRVHTMVHLKKWINYGYNLLSVLVMNTN